VVTDALWFGGMLFVWPEFYALVTRFGNFQGPRR